jgi:lysylphosphatidylglycerol synthetase-like protein (DUF2156 family)
MTDESRYAAPRAPVADPTPARRQPGKRPWPISIASLLLIAVVANACLRAMEGVSYLVAVHAFWIVVLTIIALAIERGHNWARWSLAVVTGLNVMALAAMLLVPASVRAMSIPDGANVLRAAAAGLCLVVGTFLVFGPGREWFRR